MGIERIRIDASYIVAFNGTSHVLLQDGVIVFEGNEIIHVGKSYTGQVDTTIKAAGKLVIPGFINLHAHIGNSSLQKSWREDLARTVKTPLIGILTTKPRKKLPGETEILAKSALLEMLRSGVTTLVDLGSPNYLGYNEAVDLHGEVGIRTYVSASYHSKTWADGIIGGGEYVYHEEEGQKEMDTAIGYLRKLDGSYDGRIRFILSPSCVDLCTPTMFQETKKLADELKLPIQTHTAQGVKEYHAMKKNYGKTPVEFLHDLGLLGPNMILGHCIYISSHHLIGETEESPELQLIARSGATVAHCPMVFARKGIALESYPKYLQHGINVGLGTDIFPQDMLNEMRLAAIIAKIIEDNPAVGTAADVFNSATLGGAKALGREDLGRITPGAKADLVIVNLKTIKMAPVRDPIKNLVYGATPNDIETVIIDGKTIVEHGNVTGLDEIKLAEALQKIGENLWAGVPDIDPEDLGRTVDEITPPSFPYWGE